MSHRSNYVPRGYWNWKISNPVAGNYEVPVFIESAIKELGDTTGKRILDCGIGSGMTTAILSRKATVYGFDSSEECIELAKATVKKYGNPSNVDLRVMDFQKLDYPNEYFDFALGIHILHHLDDLQEAGKVLYRVLKPDSKAVFVETWSRSFIRRFVRPIFINVPDLAVFASPNEKALTPDDVNTFCQPFQERRIDTPRDVFCLWKLGMLISNIRGVYEVCRIPYLMKLFTNVTEALDIITHQMCPPVRRQSYYIQLSVRKGVP